MMTNVALAALALAALIPAQDKAEIARLKQMNTAMRTAMAKQTREIGTLNAKLAVLERLATKKSKPTANPLIKGAYRKTLEKLDSKRKSLDETTDSKRARKIIDEMSQALIEARTQLRTAKKGDGR
jgi:hypothetical protein